jgi:5-methylcytosine-specific restriction endonuclease McrA
MKTKPVSYYSHKADKLLQELFRLNHTTCEICGNTMSCAHHYYPKSSAGNLRYNFLNLISICQGCHFRLHNGYPEIQNAINKGRGDKWLKELQEAKKIPILDCNTARYYKAKIEELKELINNFN